MQTGISVYFGLDNTLKENVELIQTAAQSGCKKIFTSLHIPEANYMQLKQEFTVVRETAIKAGMELIADVSPIALRFLQLETLDFAQLSQMGIKTVRVDYGYDSEKIAEYTHNTAGIRIQLNASTITEDFLTELRTKGADFRAIDALHNFYPRVGTGLSETFFVKKTQLLKRHHLRVGAFVPSKYRPRSPLRDGLPTLEMHRECSFDFAVRHLQALGMDMIFVGDSLPARGELAELNALQEAVVCIKAQRLAKEDYVDRLLKNPFTTRLDEARDAIRTQESRMLCLDSIVPAHTVERPYGAVTLDNVLYGRYMGELQIVKNPQPADRRVNVIAQIQPEEQSLLTYLTPGKRFALKII